MDFGDHRHLLFLFGIGDQVELFALLLEIFIQVLTSNFLPEVLCFGLEHRLMVMWIGIQGFWRVL